MITQSKSNRKETAVYIHIPFCEHKCIYCDFYSIITKDNIASFLQALKKEINHYASLNSSGRIISSIYFGGGTPSLVNPPYIYEVVNLVSRHFKIDDKTEITLETNPGTVDKTKLVDFKNIGINRLSIGIQSFDENDLKFLTRIHDKKTAIETVIAASKSGFENISIDLIFNLPQQTKDKWEMNLKTAASLPIKHISAYSLILERGTILNKMVIDGKVKIQDEDHDADLYEMTIEFLTNEDFNQYEVSNFAKQGYECKHNNSYWHYLDYFGFGPSSHSFIDGKRYWNFSSLKRYISEIEKYCNAVAGHEYLTIEQMLNEYIMLALRSNGINTIELNESYGSDWLLSKASLLNSLEANNLITRANGYLKLTKAGYAICDEIIKNLI